MSTTVTLPEGYTQLPYIEATGKQYIDTGITPTVVTRVDAELELSAPTEGSTVFLFGSPVVTGACYHIIYSTTAGYGCFSGSASAYITDVGPGHIAISFNGFTGGTINESTTGMLSGTTYTPGGAMTIGYAEGYDMPSMKIYSFAIYESTSMSTTYYRSFVPCLSEEGVAGLYDTVEGIFFGSAGAEAFVAGEESGEDAEDSAPEETLPAPVLPDAIASLDAVRTAEGIALSWAAVSGATGYKVYKNHVLLAAVTECVYLDTAVGAEEAYTCNRYDVAAYNQDGEGKEATARIQMGGSEDVLGDLITDRTLEDVINGTDKGAYNARDLNRVALACAMVGKLLRQVGYKEVQAPDALWAMNDIPGAQALETHLALLRQLDKLNCGFDSSTLPTTMENLSYAGANAMERLLLCTGRAAQRIPQVWVCSGEADCGF